MAGDNDTLKPPVVSTLALTPFLISRLLTSRHVSCSPVPLCEFYIASPLVFVAGNSGVPHWPHWAMWGLPTPM